MAEAALLGDWGGTNLRAWVVNAGGQVRAHRSFDLGVNQLKPGEAAARFAGEVRPAMDAETLPALLCGAIGSNVGWMTAPYVDCPADLDAIARSVTRVPGDGPPVWIAPGIRSTGITAAPEVLRGEETQAFGWLALDPARRNGRHLVCQPGTHSKWLRIENGRITRFVSAFTGEVFELMTRASLLKVASPFVDDQAAFDAGVAAAGDGGGLLTRLYAARGRIAGASADPASTPSFVSGVLIGSEVATAPAFIGAELGETIEVIGGARLTGLYAAVLARYGWTARQHDGEAASLAGLTALAQRRGMLEGR